MSTSLSCDMITKFYFEASNYNILIVEDSKSINGMLTKSFSQRGFNCYSTFTLGDARTVLKETIVSTDSADDDWVDNSDSVDDDADWVDDSD